MALNYNKKGSVNYTIVGTPTIVDGVASGFSDSNYLKLSSSFSEQGDIDIVVKITTDNDLTAGQYPLSWDAIPPGTTSLKNGGLYITQSKYGFLVPLVDGTLQQHTSPSAYALSANTTYYLRLLFTAADKSLKMGASTDGVNYTYGINITLTANLCPMNVNVIQMGRAMPSNYYFRGSVDVNETYIKVNGQPWFGVCPVEVKHINYGTSVGYTKEGSPTINNGVASGFSDSNYLKLSSSFSEQGDIDIVVKITTDNDLTAGQYPLSWDAIPASANRICGLYIIQDGKYGFVLRDTADNNYQNTAPSAYALSANTTYYLRLLFTAADKSLKMGASTDGVNYTYGINITLTANLCPMNVNVIQMGRARANGYPFLGSIDLNETYIKVNGKLWFYRPVTNYLVKEGKLVFADSDVYIDDNGTKTYASANIAPVPSGFTYGTTTTTDVGLVNMVTQAFTAVPGATWGKD